MIHIRFKLEKLCLSIAEIYLQIWADVLQFEFKKIICMIQEKTEMWGASMRSWDLPVLRYAPNRKPLLMRWYYSSFQCICWKLFFWLDSPINTCIFRNYFRIFLPIMSYRCNICGREFSSGTCEHKMCKICGKRCDSRSCQHYFGKICSREIGKFESCKHCRRCKARVETVEASSGNNCLNCGAIIN